MWSWMRRGTMLVEADRDHRPKRNQFGLAPTRQVMNEHARTFSTVSP
jgi:hypothetical protein